MEPPPPPPPPPPMDQQQEDQEEEPPEPEEEEQDQEDAPPQVPEEFMFDVEGVAIDSDVMKFTDSAKSGRSGSRGKIMSDERGRYIKARLPKGKVKKLAVDATLRAAAPYQKRRREKVGVETGVFVESSDI